MKKSLIEILIEALLNKKIKLYHIEDTKSGLKFYLIDKEELYPTYKIIGESYGFIKSIETSHDKYEGDNYDIVIVDGEGKPMHTNGLNSITSKFELI